MNKIKIEESKFKDYKQPYVLWAQRKDKVVLTITELNIKPPKVDVFFKKMSFISETNDKTPLKLKFDIDFYSDIKKDIHVDTRERFMKLIVTKKEKIWWPRLTREKERFPWIFIDYDLIEDEDDEENFNGKEIDRRYIESEDSSLSESYINEDIF